MLFSKPGVTADEIVYLLRSVNARFPSARLGPEDVLVAHWGKNRFEPGSMFRARSGQERVKLMFDDLCAAMTVLRRLKSAVG